MFFFKIKKLIPESDKLNTSELILDDLYYALDCNTKEKKYRRNK